MQLEQPPKKHMEENLLSRSELAKLFPLVLALGATVIGFNALFRGLSWDLAFVALGFIIGLPILNIDRLLAKYIGTREDVFHLFALYPFLFALAIFVITASGSAFGRGMVLSMLLHSAVDFKDKFQLRFAVGLLGVASLLAIFY